MGRDEISVLVVDDDHLVRQALLDYLGVADDIVVLATCESGEEALEFVRENTVDVVLMDIHLPGIDGVKATKAVRAAQPSAKVLVLTSFDDDEALEGALNVGASGFLLKTTSAQALTHAIRGVYRGISVISEAPMSRFRRPRASSVPELDVPELSGREREILGHLCQGLSNSEIAAQVFLSESTVKSYVTALMGKLGVSTRLKAVIRAHELGLDQR